MTGVIETEFLWGKETVAAPRITNGLGSQRLFGPRHAYNETVSGNGEPRTIVGPEVLGRWMIERWYVWQMRLLDAKKLSRFCRARGVQVTSSSGKDVERLWQMGLLRADYVRSDEELTENGLVKIRMDRYGRHLYADARRPTPRAEGFVGAAAGLERLSPAVKPFFHPFRFYVIQQLLQPVLLGPRPNITPISTFTTAGANRYAGLVEKELGRFNDYTRGESFLREVERANDVAELAVAAEPCVYERMFGGRRVPGLEPEDLGISVEEYLALGSEARWERTSEFQKRGIEEHGEELSRYYRDAGVERLEEVRERLCIDSERLYKDKNVLNLLRLARGRVPLGIEGDVGAALLVRIMAETLRRFSEETFGKELPEEDELGFGMRVRKVKVGDYGSHRLLDGERGVANAFMRRFGLDHSVRVRWYVEGYTEWGALGGIFGRYGGTGMELHNLSGQVVSNRWAAFESNLQTDLEGKVFSFVMIDGDRKDYVGAVRRAAREDRFCGRFFIQEPDFEFANFSLPELEEMIWEIAEENGAIPEDRQRLHEALQEVTNGDQLIRKAKAALTVSLRSLRKNQDWGERLMLHAWENPEDHERKTRPVMEAVWAAWRGLQTNFDYERANYRVDPDTGDTIEW